MVLFSVLLHGFTGHYALVVLDPLQQQLDASAAGPRDRGRQIRPGRERRSTSVRRSLRGQAGQLGSDHARQRLVHDPAPLQPARTVLHQEWRSSEVELVR